MVKELDTRFGLIESRRTYRLQFNRRKQLVGETPEKFAADLKRLYDKAYKNRDFKTRQEDLLQKFLLGLYDYKARIHIELNKDPQTIEEAVHEVLNYMETMKNPDQTEDGKRSSVRQVKKDFKNESQTLGKLNGKRPDEPRQNQSKADKKTAVVSEQIAMNRQELENLISEIISNKQLDSKAPIINKNGKSFDKASDYRNQNFVSRNRTLLCFNCGQPGHLARNCFGPKKFENQVGYGQKQEFSRQNPTDFRQNMNFQGRSPTKGVNTELNWSGSTLVAGTRPQ